MKGHHLSISSLIFLCLTGFLCNPTVAQKKKQRKKEKIETVISAAQSYIGTPYKWGGNTKGGIDCSGLIQNLYKTIDLKLPRTAREQSKIGKKRGWGGIRPGDIVFFKFKEKRSKWWHSGMITFVGNDQVKFLHASSSRGVIESDLMSDYYKKNVKHFRRVIK